MSLDSVHDSIESVIKSSKVLSEKLLGDKNAVEVKNTETLNNNNVNNNIKQRKQINLFQKSLIVKYSFPTEIDSSPEVVITSSNDLPKLDVEIVKLPENLPNEILVIIGQIKDAASRTTEGKVKFFSGPVSDMLLR